MSKKTASNKGKGFDAAAKAAKNQAPIEKTNTDKNKAAEVAKDSKAAAVVKAEALVNAMDKTPKNEKKTEAQGVKPVSKRGRIIGGIVVALLILLGVGTGVACAMLNHSSNDEPEEVAVVEEPETPEEPEEEKPEEPEETTVNTDPLVTEPIITDNNTYQVAGYKPRYLSIPSLGLYSIPIIEVGKEGDGTLGAPQSDYVIAWFYRSALPGQPGAAVMDGHGGDLGTGILKTLPRIAYGAEIIVEMGDGRRYTYVVEEKTYKYIGEPADSYMDVAYTPLRPGESTLALITCTGAWLRDQWTYDQRLFVRAALR